ncbi:cytochrome P460 family protein [Bosea sp. 47.2.35]|jgi:hypothetical protein|uniref:cytochrome P460 family protein n=1 Tax=Bosea sp. 47.2.35 TaxID=2969304 RepID=UPI00214FAEBC|nr:cytochrome P460 family protein [Bosea sp. 47.2.35]MCR4524207.1 cytochrome P460 family protein [Bosea sp. 47.2.35]
MRLRTAAGLGAGGLIVATLAFAQTTNDAVTFPEAYRNDVHYGTVTRGNIREELFASPAALAAAREGRPFPEGTIITMEDHRDGGLHRYVVMEKRAEWGRISRAGQWQFREFAPDKSPNPSEDGSRCAACHQSQAANDFVFTTRQMREPK